MGADVQVPEVGRRDWEDPMTVEWNKRHAHVPLHCHSDIEGEEFLFNLIDMLSQLF